MKWITNMSYRKPYRILDGWYGDRHLLHWCQWREIHWRGFTTITWRLMSGTIGATPFSRTKVASSRSTTPSLFHRWVMYFRWKRWTWLWWLCTMLWRLCFIHCCCLGLFKGLILLCYEIVLCAGIVIVETSTTLILLPTHLTAKQGACLIVRKFIMV